MNVDLLTAPQFRAARALLNLSRDEVEAKTGLPSRGIEIAETDPSAIKIEALERLVTFYGRSGVTFVRDAGRVGALLRQ